MATQVTWTPPAQFGSGPPWADATNITLDGTVMGGMIFDAANSQSFSTAVVDGASRVMDAPVLTLIEHGWVAAITVGSSSPVSVEYGLVPDPTPDNYSTSLLPWARSEVSLGTYSFSLVEEPFFSTATTALTAAAVRLIRAYVTSRALWNGRIAISLRNLSGPSRSIIFRSVGTGEKLLTTQAAWFSGLKGGPRSGKVRAVRDTRYAFGAFSHELVRDGNNEGLWVRAHDYDPEDPEAKYRPSPREGTRTDQVPDQ